MSEWIGITDDNLPFPKVADGALAASRDFAAGLTELGGYRNEDDDRKWWTCAVFGVGGRAVAVHIDWEEQSIVVAQESVGQAEPGLILCKCCAPPHVMTPSEVSEAARQLEGAEEQVRPHPTGGWPQRILVVPLGREE